MRNVKQPLALLLGVASAALAIFPPLSSAAQILFAAHMAQHLLLITVAAPLLALGGCTLRVRPVWAWTIFVSVFLFWHWPVAFRWAALYPPTQFLELLSILLAALLFWGAVLGRSILTDGARALLVVTAAVVTDLPGVVMLFAPSVICTMPRENAAAFGLSPLADQQLAGLLMWVPANMVFFGFATFLFA